MTTYSRSERAGLRDLLDRVGPDAPTRCEGWAAHDLADHLFIRERRPVAAAGIFVPALAAFAHRASARAEEKYGYAGVVDLLRHGPPTWSVHHYFDEAMNHLEYFVHHEDVRRAQLGCAPRVLEPGQEYALWGRLARAVKLRVAKVPAGVVLRREGTDEVLRGSGDDAAATVLVGPPSELVLYAFGRTGVAVLTEPG